MKSKLIQVAIDGPAGAGKTTVGQLVASKLGIIYLSTGRIFRSYAYALKTVDCRDKKTVKNELGQFKFEFIDGNFYINNLNVSREITNDSHSMNASIISSYPFVRRKYEKDLKKIVKKNSLVMDGRDIGTVIIPRSPFKFYLDASINVRAKRRAKELRIDLGSKEFKGIKEALEKRDAQDKKRKISPLRRAKGAIYIKSDNMTAEQVADFICEKVNKIRGVWSWNELH